MENKDTESILTLLEASHRRGAESTLREVVALHRATGRRRWRRGTNGLCNLAVLVAVFAVLQLALAWIPGPAYGTFATNGPSLVASAHCRSIQEMLA